MNKINKRDLDSLNLKSLKIDQLNNIFPNIFSEGKINLDILKEELGDWINDEKDKYSITWSGKSDSIKAIQQSSQGTLMPDRKESLHFDEAENLIIEGDNLEVLKILQRSYQSKIKMIYIDPPYNTGKDFIYPDNFKEGLTEYLLRTKQIDGDGFKFSSSTESGGRFHSKWLTMMYPRLYLSRNLLREDGVIFISIDDNELSNLHKIMDNIYGEMNFIACLPTIMNQKGNNDEFGFAGTHEYILVYAKNLDSLDDLGGLLLTKDDEKEYDLSDEMGKYKKGATLMRTGVAGSREMRPTTYYPIYVSKNLSKISVDRMSKDDYEIYPKLSNGKEMSWRRSKENLSKSLGEFIITKSSAEGIGFYKKQRLNSDKEKGKKPKSILYKPEYSSGNGTEQLKELFGERIEMNPKPLELLNDLIQIGLGSEGIILDFFAGTGTTGHSILSHNLRDLGNRKYILVQLPEKNKNLKFPTISALTRERIKRAIKKETTNFKNKEFIKKNGFKSFYLNSSNFLSWPSEFSEKDKLIKNLELFSNNLNPKSTTEDILYEILLRSGLQLDLKIEKILIDKKEIFSILSKNILICLDKNLTIEVIEKMIKLKPSEIICLDEGFNGNDQLKINSTQKIKFSNQNEASQIIFRVF